MKTIYQKLAVVKATIGAVQKDSSNPFYKSKYFDINSLLAQLEPLLEDQGLIVLQPLNDNAVCTEIIDVESGEKITSCMALPELTDPQKMGSAVTYYRRYSLTSLLSLQAEDDDGNKAGGKIKKKSKLDDERFANALSAIEEGKTTKAKVLELFELTPEQKKQL